MHSPDAEHLFGCHTQDLRLFGNNIGDAGLTDFAKAVESGALAQCTYINLGVNQIGDAGLSALAGALSSGALDNLTVCWRPTALPPCLETLLPHSTDILFDVQYAAA